jgi:3-phenylpropionate/trans-cinnamate dioxygenase ferredoxin subunit
VTTPDFVRVGALAEIADGELRPYDTLVGRVAVAHIENELFALGDACTNDGCPLSEGKLDDHRDTVIADCGSEFDLRSGEPLEGPAQDPVPVYPARMVDGWVEIAPSREGQPT